MYMYEWMYAWMYVCNYVCTYACTCEQVCIRTKKYVCVRHVACIKQCCTSLLQESRFGDDVVACLDGKLRRHLS